MHFSKTTEYAIRVLLYIHAHAPQPQSVTTIHQALGLPYKYLTKMMTELVKQELLIAQRGRDGGFILAREAESITLNAILEALGESMQAQRCILGFEACDATHPCALHQQWVYPKKLIETMLQESTLATLLRDHTKF